uniref:Uncharacterized protein n=1 Tax=Trypanosoma vivax (strain Y486) TaxID=1055687 RepID=G0U0C9_TRYVY|nr:hypothetical protein TVY486_0801350 [Trypanosoma vivax Y486]
MRRVACPPVNLPAYLLSHLPRKQRPANAQPTPFLPMLAECSSARLFESINNWPLRWKRRPKAATPRKRMDQHWLCELGPFFSQAPKRKAEKMREGESGAARSVLLSPSFCQTPPLNFRGRVCALRPGALTFRIAAGGRRERRDKKRAPFAEGAGTARRGQWKFLRRSKRPKGLNDAAPTASGSAAGFPAKAKVCPGGLALCF